MNKNPKRSWRQMSVDVIIWSGVGVAFILEMLATHIIHNDLLHWLAFGVITLVFVLAIKTRRRFLSRDIFPGQVEEFIVTMVVVCFYVAAFFGLLAGSFHLALFWALFWWLTGIALVTGVILRIVLIFQIKSQEKKAREQE